MVSRNGEGEGKRVEETKGEEKKWGQGVWGELKESRIAQCLERK